MAYAITATPPSWASVHDSLVYTVKDTDKTSDPVTYPNFKFIADVYVNSTLQARLKVVPDPVNGAGVFDIGMICRNFVSCPFDPVPAVLLAQEAGEGAHNMVVQVQFGEEWDYTPSYSLLTNGSQTFFNSYNTRGFIASLENKRARAATNRPANCQVYRTSNFLLFPFFALTTDAIPIVVTPVGGGFPLTTSYTPTDAFSMASLNLSPNVINSLQPGTIAPSTTSYRIDIGLPISGIDTYYVDIICEAIYKPYAIHFLNQYGGFDTKFFSKVSRKTVSATKTSYGQKKFSVASDGSVSFKSENNVWIDQAPVYASQYQDKMQLNTDLLTDQEYTWLREMILSPVVYLEDDTGLFPISITDTDYEAKKVVNDDLTNLTINIQFGGKQNAQFR